MTCSNRNHPKVCTQVCDYRTINSPIWSDLYQLEIVQSLCDWRVSCSHPCDTGSIPSTGKLVNRFCLSPTKHPSKQRGHSTDWGGYWIDTVLCILPPVLRNKASAHSQNMLPPVSKGLVLFVCHVAQLLNVMEHVASNASYTYLCTCFQGLVLRCVSCGQITRRCETHA